ncbi:MAG: hypothetical protein AAF517_18570 [Planctomycetota bacterium]
MPHLSLEIVRFLDDHQPGFVECRLIDAHGREWMFHEKIPVLTAEDLWKDSEYPRPGSIQCEVLGPTSEGFLTISTETPDHVEAIDGTQRFEVRRDQLLG